MRQKNKKNKRCIRCNVLLTNKNWLKYLKPRSNYICTPCFRNYGKNYYNSDRPVNIEKISKILTPHAKNQKERTRLLSKKRYLDIKKLAIDHYGGKCDCCDKDDLNILTIDHIDNNGGAHRKNIKTTIYKWLKNNKYPDGYQVLCFNCNCSKTAYKNSKYKNYDLINKQTVMKYYGGKCVGCGELKIEKLTIDHIYNNGAEHRRKTRCGTGQAIYRWIIKNKYPKDIFQILCFNCNCKKRSCKIAEGDII